MGQGCKSFQPLSVSHDTLATFPGGRQLRPLRRRVGGLALFFVRMLLGCMLLANNCALAYAVHDLDRGGAAGARWRTQFLRSHARAVADHGNTIDAGTPFATRKQAALRSAISDLVAEGALGAARYLPRCALRSVHAARFDAARFRAEHQSPRVPLLATGLYTAEVAQSFAPSGLLRRACLGVPIAGVGSPDGARTHHDFVRQWIKQMKRGVLGSDQALAWPAAPPMVNNTVLFPTVHAVLRAMVAHERVRNAHPVNMDAAAATGAAAGGKEGRGGGGGESESELPDHDAYLRDYMFWRACPGMLAQLGVPRWIAEDWDNALLHPCAVEPTHPHLMAGVAGTRGSMHIDSANAEAWSVQLYGRKAWVLADPKLPLADASALCAFVQPPNTLLYLPASTTHGVLNLDLSISVINNFYSGGSLTATEYESPPSDWKERYPRELELLAQCRKFFFADGVGRPDGATLEQRCARSSVCKAGSAEQLRAGLSAALYRCADSDLKGNALLMKAFPGQSDSEGNFPGGLGFCPAWQSAAEPGADEVHHEMR